MIYANDFALGVWVPAFAGTTLMLRRQLRRQKLPSPQTKTSSAPKTKSRRCRRLFAFSLPVALVRGFQGCGLLPGDGALHGRLHLLEGAHLDLAHPLAGDA